MRALKCWYSFEIASAWPKTPVGYVPTRGRQPPVGWVERSGTHHFSAGWEQQRWVSLRSTHPTVFASSGGFRSATNYSGPATGCQHGLSSLYVIPPARLFGVPRLRGLGPAKAGTPNSRSRRKPELRAYLSSYELILSSPGAGQGAKPIL